MVVIVTVHTKLDCLCCFRFLLLFVVGFCCCCCHLFVGLFVLYSAQLFGGLGQIMVIMADLSEVRFSYSQQFTSSACPICFCCSQKPPMSFLRLFRILERLPLLLWALVQLVGKSRQRSWNRLWPLLLTLAERFLLLVPAGRQSWLWSTDLCNCSLW